MERRPLKIKPKFWGDALWFYPILIVIMCGSMSVMMWRLSGGKDYWLGLAFIVSIIIAPIFLLLWIDNLSNRAVFEDDQLILKGFLHKKKIPYKDIKDITFSDLQNAGLIYFNEKKQRNDYLRLPIWNQSINALIDEIKKRAGIQVDGYPTRVNRANFFGKIWMLAILALTFVGIVWAFWTPLELKVPNQNNVNVVE